jgi:hypothetical protein
MPRLARSVSVVVLLVAALALGFAAGYSRTTPAHAYGAENWQIGFAGTGVAPGTGFGFGFWGWCALGGGVTSGTTGDCQIAQYLHTAAGGGLTCQQSLDITAWSGAGGTFVITGTSTVNPLGSHVAVRGDLAGWNQFQSRRYGDSRRGRPLQLWHLWPAGRRVPGPGHPDSVGADRRGTRPFHSNESGSLIATSVSEPLGDASADDRVWKV